MYSDNFDSVTNNLRNSANGTFVTSDDTIPLTGYELIDTELNDSVPSKFIDFQEPLVHFTPSSDHDKDDETLGKLLAEVHRDYADYRRAEGASVSPPSMSVMIDRTEQPVEGITGIAGERESSGAQIWTLFNEQRRTIIAECCEKVSHHEFQADWAEQERKIVQEELWRQQQDFREVHQQSLTEVEELRKFQSSTFDAFFGRKLVEDQKTIVEFSGRLQELQNEVDCMNDSKDFQDAESVRSGNSHVTSQPMLVPKHTAFEELLRPSLVYTWFIRKRFCKSTSFLFSSLSSRTELSLEENCWGNASHVYSGEEW